MSELFSMISTSQLITFGLIFVLLFSFISVYQRLAQKIVNLQHQLQNAQNEIRAINSGNLGMGRKLNRFAEDISNVEIMGLQQELPSMNEKIYKQAALLLSRGATPDEVVESCEITPAEAELLAIMHHFNPQKAAAV